MSAIRRVLSALPASTSRSYSSYSSFKSGGGRYFNSSKVNKSAVVAANDAAGKAEPAAVATSSTPDGTSSNTTTPPRSLLADTEDSVVAPPPSSSSPPTDHTIMAAEHPVEDLSATHMHPVLTAKDFKLHQFFSLHRPLLLMHNPPSLFNPAPRLDAVLSASGQARQRADAVGHQKRSSGPISVFEDFPADSSIDADAEAARQLARGLTMNKVGPAVEWEATLKRLGLDPARDPQRIELQQQMDKDWEDVQILLDSTKRKRSKKMKKHKLKKRRKATRASRLKLK